MTKRTLCKIYLWSVTLKINNQDTKLKKKNKLRVNEYYDTQKMYDELYAKSSRDENFYKVEH